MTIDEAIREIQGKSAGITGRATVEYAQKQLQEGEKVFAAASANIQAHRGNFPGLIVFTDQRLFAASGLPGVRCLISLPLREPISCKDRKTPLSYSVTAATGTDSFTAMLSPQAGGNFAPYISALAGAVRKRYA